MQELSSCPKLEVIDQPTQYHRFRYESEVAKGTQGGYLYSRCADGKSPVRLRLSGLDVLAYRSVRVIGGTVSSDLYPHPYFMLGDNCTNGLYQFTKELSSLDGRTEVTIALDKVSLVCVKSGNLSNALQRRINRNFNPFQMDPSQVDYAKQKKYQKPIRLAFQAFYIDSNNTMIATGAMVATEEIAAKSKEAQLNFYGVHPTEAPVAGLTDFWVYFDKELQRSDLASYSARIEAEPNVLFACTMKQVKKHLLIVTKPDVAHWFVGASERIAAKLIISETHNDITCDSEIILLNSPTAAHAMFSLNYLADNSDQDPPTKRKRPEPQKPGDVDLSDLLASFANQ
uniref:RHD domain-containing protein n=1 Tax=Macrostomum lignano TaxID=282301 RepID=A0A1I8JHR7_9PLAT